MDRSLASLAAAPAAVRAQLPGERVVFQAAVERVLELGLERVVLYGHHELDTVVEVARHQVGRAYVVARLAVSPERVDARVLEEAADHRRDADVLAHTRDAGPKRADASHVQVDLHAGPRGLVQRLDAAAVGERVQLHDYERVL